MPFAELSSANQSPQAKGGGGQKKYVGVAKASLQERKEPSHRTPPQGGATGNPPRGGWGCQIIMDPKLSDLIISSLKLV